MVHVEASAAIDLGSKLDALGGSFEKGLGGIARAMARPPAQPFTFRPNASGVSGASGDLVLGIGGPKSGQFWQVLGVTIGGSRWASVVAGTALVVVSSTRPAKAADTPTQWVLDEFAALPKATFYSRGQVELTHPESLYLVIATPTAATEYDAAATVEVFQTADRIQTAAS